MRRRRRSTKEYLVAAILALTFIWLSWQVVAIFFKEERARKAANDAKAELVALSEREETLRNNLEELATERGQEASFRETYGVARPGEEVIIVVPAGDGEALGELPWWRSFLGFFGL